MSASPAWSMTDVQALSTAKSWNELLAGAGRVPPSARTREWFTSVSAAARGRLRELVAEPSSGTQARDLVELVTTSESTYSFLAKDGSYLTAKAAALGSVLDFCEKSRADGCSAALEALSRGISSLPKGAAEKIALLMTDDQRMPSETFRFWAMAATDDKASCKYGGLQSATLGALASEKSDVSAKGIEVAKLCYAPLEDGLVGRIESADKASRFAANVCPILKAHGKTTMATRDKCP